MPSPASWSRASSRAAPTPPRTCAPTFPRIARIVQRFHDEMPRHVSGPGFMFWVFHVIRDYARTLKADRSRMSDHLAGYVDSRTNWKAPRCRCRSSSATMTSCRPTSSMTATPLAHRFRICRLRHRHVRPCRHRLERRLLQAKNRPRCWRVYFDTPPTHALRRIACRHAMRLAAARGDVGHGVGTPPRRPRRRLRRLCTAQPRQARCRARRLQKRLWKGPDPWRSLPTPKSSSSAAASSAARPPITWRATTRPTCCCSSRAS